MTDFPMEYAGYHATGPYEPWPEDEEPLWQVMELACRLAPNDYRAERAAEIRALTDWLVPEPEEPGFTASDEAFAIWEERKAVRKRLLAEAERAENKEVK
jgi:hypothetical protein